MNVKQLRSFACIVELGSQTNAARSLNISESALSRQVALLENELGFTLFERDKVRLVPTALGERFCREVERVLSSFDQLPKIAQELLQEERQRLRLVFIQRIADAFGTPAAAELQDRHPNIDLTIDIQPNRTMESRIRGLQYDIAVRPLDSPATADHPAVVIAAPMVAVLHKTHALAGKARLRLSDLAGERLALTAHDSLMRRQIDRMFARDGARLSASIDVSETLLACQLAAQNHAVTICDPFSPSAHLSDVSVIPIEPRFEVAFIAHRASNAHTVVAEFEQILVRRARDYLAKLGLDRSS